MQYTPYVVVFVEVVERDFLLSCCVFVCSKYSEEQYQSGMTEYRYGSSGSQQH